MLKKDKLFDYQHAMGSFIEIKEPTRQKKETKKKKKMPDKLFHVAIDQIPNIVKQKEMHWMSIV